MWLADVPSENNGYAGRGVFGGFTGSNPAPEIVEKNF
jgi:hypothetical protein